MPNTTPTPIESHQTCPSSYDPFLRGPFPVGVRTFEARDDTRNRLFPCEVWYPASPEHSGQDLDPHTQDRFAPRLGTLEQRQSAVRNASPLAGSYPLIAFSHHSGGTRRASSFLCTHLSSHGYIVAALDHSEVIAPELARRENETEADKKARWQTVISSRVPDVRFLLNHLLHRGAWNYAATIDPDHIGVVGHSFGGWTVLTLPEVDNSISAIVALAPGGNSNPRPGILPARLDFRWQRDIPTLYLVAENDVPLPLSGMYELFERTPSRKQMVILRRADHLHFIDNIEQQHEAFRTMAMPPEVSYMQKEMHPISQLVSGERAQLWVRGLALAHMDAFLKSHSEARQFLAGDLEAELASRGVEVIFYKP